MKKLFKVNIWIAALALLVFASCEDDKKTDDGIDSALEADYSTVSPEESKQDVENAAVNLVSQIDELEDEDGIDVMIHMMDLMGGNDAPASAQFNIPLKAAQILADDSKNSAEVYNLLKATTEEGLALSDSFAMLTATYTYNFETLDFDKTENANDIVILFPGKESDLTNTAEILIGDFTVKEITEPRADFDLPAGKIEFPTGLKATLKYNDNTLMSYTLTAEYLSDGTPTALENVLEVGSFSFTQTLKHSQYKSAGFDFSFKNGSDILIAFGAEINGDWSENNINENSETDVEEIINNGNAYLQFMDLKAVGQIDIQTIVNGEQAFEEAHLGDSDDIKDLPEAENLVSLFTENARFVLVYTKDNTMLAYLEPYVMNNTNSYNQNGVIYTENDYYMDMRLVFNDNSKISMDTFVENELNGFFNALNDFIYTLNTTYGTEFNEVSMDDESL
ncbi:hypothetical protein [Plebeiibacterium sediminum]|uniref:Uncharacterized protein n=1 Tax=Plebeiibacterium sediminum TaxID=2992112 RepID=A0AAE3M518_9BACT|nr:hypothetical protein [Plebeiobacterium sediminum]MCW3787071.1 hypothetical protein [Plebeiobacterium sediminum]